MTKKRGAERPRPTMIDVQKKKGALLSKEKDNEELLS